MGMDLEYINSFKIWVRARGSVYVCINEKRLYKFCSHNNILTQLFINSKAIKDENVFINIVLHKPSYR